MTAANPSPDNALRECLVRVSDWLTAALDCPRFLWDGDQHDAATHARDEAAVALSSSPASEALGSALRVALEEVRDLLTEKIYGNPARSPAHNARVKLDTAIASLPAALSASAGGGIEEAVDIRAAVIREVAATVRGCQYDGGFDRENGPIGCYLTLQDGCVCAGIHSQIMAMIEAKPSLPQAPRS